MQEKRRTDRSHDRPRGKGSPSLELYLEGFDSRTDPLERGTLREALRVVPGFQALGEGEWEHRAARCRLVRGESRLVLALALEPGKSQELTRRIDELFELAFALSEELGLVVVDPYDHVEVTRQEFEQRWSRIVRAWEQHAAERLATSDPAAWTGLGPGVRLAGKLPPTFPVLRLDLSALRRVTGGDPGELRILTLTGGAQEIAGRLNQGLPFLVVVSQTLPGTSGWMVRVHRVSRPVKEVALLEVSVQSRVRLKAILRDPAGLSLGEVVPPDDPSSDEPTHLRAVDEPTRPS